MEAALQPFVSYIAARRSGISGVEVADGAAEDNDEISIILFEIGQTQFALPTMRVIEVVRVEEIVAIPRAPSFIEGVIEVRDAVLPVIDLRKKLGARAERHALSTIIVAEVQRLKTGFIVDSAKKVITLAGDEMQNLGTAVTGQEARYIYRTINRDKTPIVILNLDTLMNSHELESLAELEGGKA
ncbi:MAG TPA: chemotaxis protein CheW [Turneriella sp.]|nr:chemotaxis protein CheW [Turneriella sp.]